MMTSDKVIVSGPITFKWGDKEYPYSEGTQEALDWYHKAARAEEKRHKDRLSKIEDTLTSMLGELYED